MTDRTLYRLASAIGVLIGAAIGGAIYGLGELIAHTWNPFA